MRAGDDVQGNGTYSGGEKRMRLTLTFSISVGERGGSGDGMGEDGEEGEEVDSPLMESSMVMDDCL